MPTDKEKESASVGPFAVLKNFAEISIVAGTGLFVIGWSYLYGYYHLFGLSAAEISFSPQAVLTYSLPVVLTKGSLLLVGTLFFAIILIYLIKPFFALRSTIVAAAVLILIFIGSRHAGTEGRVNAKRDASLSTSTLPYVNLYGLSAAEYGGCNLDEWNYRLLLRANGQIYVILPIDNSGELVGTNLRVCSFPETRIQAVRIQVGLEKK